jgi:hypothetical protein
MKLINLITCLFLIISCQNKIKKTNSDPLTILSSNHSECLDNCDINSRLISQSFTDSIYHVTMGVHLNCNDDVITKAELRNDTLCISIEIKPKQTEEGSWVIEEDKCNCFYHFYFEIKGLRSVPSGFLINGLTFKENYDQNCEIIEEDSPVGYSKK